jgi:hypothetical protein
VLEFLLGTGVAKAWVNRLLVMWEVPDYLPAKGTDRKRDRVRLRDHATEKAVLIPILLLQTE